MHPADQDRLTERLEAALISSDTSDAMEAERALQLRVRASGGTTAAVKLTSRSVCGQRGW